MGKSKNASFSSVDKSNFQLFKEKFKEKSESQKLKNDKSGRNSEKEKKKKKHIWWKWLTSVRGSWSCGETGPFDANSQIMAAKSLAGSVDLFEIPIDSGRKFSKILIESSKTGSKAVIAEYSKPSSPSKKSVSRDDPFEIGELEKDETKISQESLKTNGKSLNKSIQLLNNKNEFSQKSEALLTSALFIHKDIDRMVESAVFMEPNLSRDYAESKASDEISQKSIKTNNMRLCYKNVDKTNKKIIKTFKAVSEPTWKERKKIIQEQRVKENMNYLLKQFVFMGAKDVIDFSRIDSKHAGRKRRIKFNRSSAFSSRKLSREVSPEILVNIKPFKEYVSESYENSQRPVKRSCTKTSSLRHEKNIPVGDSKNLDSKKVAKKQICPALETTVTFLKKNESVNDTENSFEFKKKILTLSPIKNKINTSSKEKGFTKASFDAPDDLARQTLKRSFRNAYEAYSAVKNFVEVEVGQEVISLHFEREKQEDKLELDFEDEDEDEDVLRSSKSLDEVLNNLDIGDHDLIFQKNISQFKKKIPVMPRLDFRKTTFSAKKKGSAKAEENRVWRSLVKVESPLRVEEPFAKVAEFLLKTSKEKKTEMYRSECFDVRTELEWKSKKILENIYLMFCESSIINQVLATRVEAKTFSFCQTLREVHDMQENNIVAVIKIENPANFDETLRKIELFRVESDKALALLKKSYPDDQKKSGTITMLLCVNKYEFDQNFASIPIAVRDADNRASENFQLLFERGGRFYLALNHFPQLSETRENCQSFSNTLNFKETLNRKFSQFSEGMKTEEKDVKRSKSGLELEVSSTEKSTRIVTYMKASSEAGCRAVLILNDPSYEYAVHIYYGNFGSVNLSKPHSEPDMVQKVFNERTPHSDSVVPKPKTSTSTEGKMVKSDTKGVARRYLHSKNDPGFCFDGFQILYKNCKETLNDDDEEEGLKTISSKCLAENQSTGLNTGSKKFIKEEWEQKEQKTRRRCSMMLERTEFPQAPERTLKSKSNSSLKENVIQTQFFLEEHRIRRSQILLREAEKHFLDIVHCGKKRLAADNVEEARRTESSLSKSDAPTSVKKEAHIQDKSSSEMQETFKRLALTDPFISNQRTGAERRKMFLLKKNGTNVKKEVMAAINFIKDLKPCKGEAKSGNKQMSLLILLSKN